jgi:hypothetical protein
MGPKIVRVIESEQVMGLADGWPIAVSRRHGELHALLEGFDIQDQGFAGLDVALKMVNDRGW